MKPCLILKLPPNSGTLLFSFLLAFFVLMSSELLAHDEIRQSNSMIFNNNSPLENAILQSPLKISSLLEEPNPRFEIVFFPLSFFVSGLEAGIEFPVRDRQALRLSAGYFYSFTAGAYNNFGETSRNGYFYSYNEMEGFRTEAQYRFYWYSDNRTENYYITPFAVFKTVTLEANRSGGQLPPQQIELNSSAASFGVLFGLKAIMLKKMSVDINIGGGMTPTRIGDYELAHIEQINPYRRSIHFKGGFTIGLLIY